MGVGCGVSLGIEDAPQAMASMTKLLPTQHVQPECPEPSRTQLTTGDEQAKRELSPCYLVPRTLQTLNRHRLTQKSEHSQTYNCDRPWPAPKPLM